MRKTSLVNKRSKWLIHMLVWAIIFLLPYIFTENHDRNPPHHESIDRSMFRTFDTVTNIFWVALFYFNAIFLTDRFLYKRKYATYICALLMLFCIIIGLHNLLFYLMYYPNTLSFIGAAMHNIIPFLFTIMVSTTYRTITDRIETDNLQKEKQNENLKTELSFLRSQISPHFIFNVLNNMVALARMKSDKLEPTIYQLSSLLQYMLYETDEEKVSLQSEVEYLKSYIDLQKQRLFSESSVTTNFNVQEENHSIEPMLLIPFVENAFKHGNSFMQEPEINISLSAVNNQLHFLVENKYDIESKAKDKTSGIGLANVKRRLALLYPAIHTLHISDKDGRYIVNLTINFKA